MNEIETLLNEQNPQWLSPNWRPEEAGWFHRPAVKEIQKWLDKRFMLALTGLRRLGKSTILKQILASVLETTDPRRTLYFSFDRLALKPEPTLFRQVIHLYLESVVRQSPHEVKKSLYFFLDEVQNIPLWQNVLKIFYDLNPRFKFFVSGSNSLFLRHRGAESLAGRLIEISLHPLSFKEFLQLKYPRFKINTSDPLWLSAKIGLLNSHFEEYLRTGQFPEIIQERLSLEEAQKYLITIEDKIIRQDLPRLYPIAYPEVLAQIFEQIKTSPGQQIEYQKVAQEALVDQRTARQYFDFLQKGFLVQMCYRFGKKPVRPLRRAKKAYLVSSNFSVQAPLPFLVENYVFNFLQNSFSEVYFYKKPEIDFVAKNESGKISLFEAKYQNQIRPEDYKNLNSPAFKQAVAQKTVITKNFFSLTPKISFFPASMLEFI